MQRQSGRLPQNDGADRHDGRGPSAHRRGCVTTLPEGA
jgi:hypothetical protein